METLTIVILVILSLLAGAFIFSRYNAKQEQPTRTAVVAPVYTEWDPWWRGSYVPPPRHYRTVTRRAHHRR